MGSTSVWAATASELQDHWAWRPEWTGERTCLYWYLTFREDEMAQAVGEDVLTAMHRTSWLDAVPPRWCHVTVTDVGFTDELEPADVEQVTVAVAEALADQPRLRLSLGPIRAHASALVLTVRPLDRLRAIKAAVRRATSATLGPRHADVHRNVYWPHLSLGYVNRVVDQGTATRLQGELPLVAAHVDVDAVRLAAVTRREHHYQWQVEAEVDLLREATDSG